MTVYVRAPSRTLWGELPPPHIMASGGTLCGTKVTARWHGDNSSAFDRYGCERCKRIAAKRAARGNLIH